MLQLETILSVGQKVLSGKDRGIDARRRFRLDEIEGTGVPVVVVIPDTLRVITPSFVLGMFSPSVSKLGSVESFFERYEFQTKSPTVIEQIQQGVKMGLVEGHALSSS